jgi:membrane protein DedA with SNARE-associated domain
MEQLEIFVLSHGYGALFLLGVAEFAAIPVATVPVLIGVGALAAAGTLSAPGAVLAVVAGGLVADIAWLSVARWRGDRDRQRRMRIIGNPRVCVLAVRDRVATLGAPYLLVGKFIPGTAMMLATAAGLACMSHRRFIVVDTAALFLWASTYLALGWLFAEQVEPLLRWTASHGWTVLALVVVGMLVAVLARVSKTRAHGRNHGAPSFLGGLASGPKGEAMEAPTTSL